MTGRGHRIGSVRIGNFIGGQAANKEQFSLGRNNNFGTFLRIRPLFVQCFRPYRISLISLALRGEPASPKGSFCTVLLSMENTARSSQCQPSTAKWASISISRSISYGVYKRADMPFASSGSPKEALVPFRLGSGIQRNPAECSETQRNHPPIQSYPLLSCI